MYSVAPHLKHGYLDCNNLGGGKLWFSNCFRAYRLWFLAVNSRECVGIWLGSSDCYFVLGCWQLLCFTPIYRPLIKTVINRVNALSIKQFSSGVVNFRTFPVLELFDHLFGWILVGDCLLEIINDHFKRDIGIAEQMTSALNSWLLEQQIHCRVVYTPRCDILYGNEEGWDTITNFFLFTLPNLQLFDSFQTNLGRLLYFNQKTIFTHENKSFAFKFSPKIGK